jgi:hypothetical protein
MQLVVRTDRRPTRLAHDVIARLRARGVRVHVIAGSRIAASHESSSLSADAWLDLRRRPQADAAPPSVDCLSLAIGSERYGLPAFDEAVHGAWSVEVQLRVVAARQTRVVRRAVFPYASRYARTLDLILNECVSWFDAPDARRGARAIENERPLPITPRVLIRFVLAELRRVAGLAVRRGFEEARWNVGIANLPLDQFLKKPAETPFHWIARSGESLADPFPVQVGNRMEVLCESIGGNRRGSIVAIDAANGATRSTLLNGSHHVSYPFAFCIGERTFFLPERVSAGRLDLFEIAGGAASFVATIAEEGLIDPTLTYFGGRFWLFGTDPKRLPNANLHAYWADSPFGPWRAHARNPVKIDITSARPAGRMFWSEGALYRPGQDCSGRYGRAVVINRIDRLDPDDFEETPVARIDPGTLGLPDSVGVHTVAAAAPYVAVDAQYVRWSWHKPLTVGAARARSFFMKVQPCAS